MRNRWTQNEVALLLSFYPQIKSVKDISDLLPRHTPDSIRLKASALGIKTNHFFTITRDELYSLYIEQQLPADRIAKIKGVTEAAVFGKLNRYNISRRSLSEAMNLHWTRYPAPTGKKSTSWRGGRTRHTNRYVEVYIAPGKYKMEHRVVMEQHLGRELFPWEVVHHKNGIKDDNRIENLELYPRQASHVTQTLFKRELHKRDKEIRLLKWQVKTLTERLNEAGIANPLLERYED